MVVDFMVQLILFFSYALYCTYNVITVASTKLGNILGILNTKEQNECS